MGREEPRKRGHIREADARGLGAGAVSQERGCAGAEKVLLQRVSWWAPLREG